MSYLIILFAVGMLYGIYSLWEDEQVCSMINTDSLLKLLGNELLGRGILSSPMKSAW